MNALRELAEELGGQFEAAGGSGPDHYGDADAEVSAARSSAIVVDRSDRGKLAITGEDRASFLHGMLTNTVQGLVEGSGNHTALTDAKGNTQADLWLYHWGDRLIAETEPGLHAKVTTFLDRYIIGDDVTISDESEQTAIISLQGPDANKIASDLLDAPVDLEMYGNVPANLAGKPARICRRSYTGEVGYDLWVAKDQAAQVFRSLVEAGATPAGDRAIEVLRIESGLPKYGVDVDDRVVPLEAGLADTVDFAKGCFIGQEVLAKMQNLGKPRRYFVGTVVEGVDVPDPETELESGGKVVGLIKSGLQSNTLGQTICLTSVRRGFESPGTRLTLPDGRACEVVTLPFVPGKSLNTNDLNVSA